MEVTQEKKPSIQNLVTIEDYALIVDKTTRTVYNWINEKRIATHEMFGKTLIDKTERPKD